ncbi:conserved hypothetical protein [Candidatus Desulfosporosinus infrequens]|uniref:Uncharacterized protein n=1 Tax=Candidatus Desulfosporosinus infrequens TaxID=2043169 RepID=A0A2U3JWF8_9FIRM|nr:conserved hypothetical protein [Candidatus Desulfosporosinus infrequens]
MSGSQPASLSKDPINMGVRILAPISSVAGSATVYFSQPILSGNVFSATDIVIGSEFFLRIVQRLFCLETLPVLDVQTGQTIQMPLSELQAFLRWIANRSDPSQNSNSVTNGTNMPITTNGGFIGTGRRGFPTPESPEAPIVVALFVTADYSSIIDSPYVTLTIPIFTVPGIRGALPLLILVLLGTILVRAVVPPEATGSKPLSKPSATMNDSTTFTPNDLLQLLTRFGKHFGSK